MRRQVHGTSRSGRWCHDERGLRALRRRYAVFAPDCFDSREAKTAHGVIRYSDDKTAVVIDPKHVGRRVCDVLPFLRNEAPIVARVADALAFNPTSLLIGVAPAGGAMSPVWRAELLTAIAAKLEIVNGLHATFRDDPELARAAAAAGVAIWDVRLPPPASLFSGKAWSIDAIVVLTVGSDAANGKMTAALELRSDACARN